MRAIRQSGHVSLLVTMLCAGSMMAPSPPRIPTTGFVLQTGPYRVTFQSGRLVIGRPGTPGGLRLSLLPGAPGLDLLSHVTARRIVRTAGGTSAMLDARTAWATATITLTTYTRYPGSLHWTVALALRGSGAPAEPAGTDLSYTNATGAKPASPAVTLYAGAAPVATALSYLYDPDLRGTLFYLADLTALDAMFQATSTSPTNGSFRDPRGGPGALVGASSTGLGLTLPPGSVSGLAPGTRPTTIMDSYLFLGTGQPTSETAVATRFLGALGAIYGLIERPALAPADWRVLGDRTARDLAGPDVVVPLGGHIYLRAYVSDRRTAPELITQLNVLVGANAFARTFGNGGAVGRLRKMLDADLPTFYSSEYGSVVNNLPLPHGPRAGSESWYYIGDLINLARVAQDNDLTARTLLLRSVHGAVALAHHVGYAFPRAILYGSWQGGGGLQPDVTGAYAYLMLQLYDLTHQRSYLDEAKAGVDHLAGYGFHLAYETHMTALAATAAARLYALTGERRYLELSLLPLANLFAATWIWDCGYGTCAGGAYHTFFGLSPLPWSGYIAMMEQEEAWQALREYALLARDQVAPSVRTLVAEFCRYTLSTLAYALPPELPKGVAGPAPGEYGFVPRNRLDLAIPLEDLRDGSQPSGQIGQEIYGAGGPLALGGLATTRLAPDLWLTSPYPATVTRTARGVMVAPAGTTGYTVPVRLDGGGASRVTAVTAANGRHLPLTRTDQGLAFPAHGGTTYALCLRTS